MNTKIDIQLATPENVDLIHQLVKTTFDYNVAPDYSATGIQEFYKYIVPDAIKNRLNNKHFILLAKKNDKAVGIIEIRNNDHISMFFVLPDHQKEGIGKALLSKAIELMKENGDVKEISVNSSPNAQHAYERMGFVATEKEKEVHGIEFVPMKLSL
jgi:GNAT superfamily N-acetyltransferase